MLLRQFAQHLIKKVASDPVARERATKVAASFVEEAKHIANKDDRAYAAGKAVRRALNKLNNS
ncbi:MAG: hypothetical protein OSB02_01890 [Rhodospirillaceae bacterium]|jgi:hypothetical protein|nr:hypothetical protein [Rhodospirillaceae bacterium]